MPIAFPPPPPPLDAPLINEYFVKLVWLVGITVAMNFFFGGGGPALVFSGICLSISSLRERWR